ncbi:glutathione S-transferase [Halteromyces radiatus]|uniref:glutathione S-transferase n=1 Tax=Halteromyces radiatus TaxID=101107 RepID=UPI00221FE131|nr:glutathione S-transferase [Halteromyces radiatus]KAI8082816.1 glutathione S-transferase [Halteromyces radiatus]
MSAGKLVLYTAEVCPYAQRARIALLEAKANFESVEIDLTNKPSWYGEVNPELKVPALKIGDKSIAESLVLTELVNDLYPEAKLLPDDPVKRAQGRFAVEFYGAKILPNLYGILRNPDQKEAFVKDIDTAYKRFNELLLEQSSDGPYFYGDKFSLVDIAIAPFAGRFNALFELAFNKGYQPPSVESLPRLKSYFANILDRPSYKETYFGDQAFRESAIRRFNFPAKD